MMLYLSLFLASLSSLAYRMEEPQIPSRGLSLPASPPGRQWVCALADRRGFSPCEKVNGGIVNIFRVYLSKS